MGDNPEGLYFRTRENGAMVFRVDLENRQRRLELQQIAVANVRNGEIKPHNETPPTDAETRDIETWIAARQKTLSNRAIDDIFRAIDHLNLTAQWAQSKASDTELEEFTDQLLMAMHDLRLVLVRKKSDRMMKAQAGR